MDISLVHGDTTIEQCELAFPPRKGDEITLEDESQVYRVETVEWAVSDAKVGVTVQLTDTAESDSAESDSAE